MSANAKSVKVTFHDVGSIECSLTGKGAQDGVVCTFDDGTVNNAALSWKALRQLLSMKLSRTKPGDNGGAKPEVKPEPKPTPTAIPVPTPKPNP